jgi:hypothetical protein
MADKGLFSAREYFPMYKSMAAFRRLLSEACRRNQIGNPLLSKYYCNCWLQFNTITSYVYVGTAITLHAERRRTPRAVYKYMWLSLSPAECACGVVYPIDFPTIRPAAAKAEAAAASRSRFCLYSRPPLFLTLI